MIRNNGMEGVAAALVLIAVAAITGCGDDGPQRVQVSGEVSYNGQPVPVGTIVFTPDASKGNSGPQGAAAIRNGKYDTAADDGRNPVAGPTIVEISAYDGVPTNPDDTSGGPLLEGHKQNIELKPENNTLDFKLP